MLIVTVLPVDECACRSRSASTARRIFAEQPRGARRRGRHHDREFLAAETRGEIARLAEAALDGRRDLLEHAVARHVAVRVVVQLEVVDVDHQQRQLAALARAAPPFRGEVFVEIAPVRQPGQAVGMREAPQLEIGFEQLLLRLPQRAVGLVALQQVHVRARVVAHACDELDAVGQLHEVVVRAGGERGALDHGLFLRRQHDDRHVARRRILAVRPHEAQPVGAGHHEVLQDHGRPCLDRGGHRVVRTRAVVEIDAVLVDERAPHGFRDDRLVIHQQHHRRHVDGRRVGAAWRASQVNRHGRCGLLRLLQGQTWVLRVFIVGLRFSRAPPARPRCARAAGSRVPRRASRPLSACRTRRSSPRPGRSYGSPSSAAPSGRSRRRGPSR